MKVGDKFTWYDGGGIWGHYNIEILEVDEIVRYIMTNTHSGESKEEFTHINIVQEYINNDDGCAWEKVQ